MGVAAIFAVRQANDFTKAGTKNNCNMFSEKNQDFTSFN